jgi:bifunctional non-homologous end joining protein LigD
MARARWRFGTKAPGRPHGDPAAGYRKGHLAFELRGRRLQGDWDLVRMRPRPGEEGKDNWLLIEHGKTAAPLQAKSTPKEKSARKQAVDPMPRIISPQLATLVDSAPEGDDWVYEIKYDGYRMLAASKRARCASFSRNGKDWTARFPRHAQALAKLPVRQAWLDGEMAVFLPDGNTSFQALQNALDEGRRPTCCMPCSISCIWMAPTGAPGR